MGRNPSALMCPAFTLEWLVVTDVLQSHLCMDLSENGYPQIGWLILNVRLKKLFRGGINVGTTPNIEPKVG